MKRRTLLIALWLPGSLWAMEIQAVRIDGSSLTGQWMGCADGGPITLRTTAGSTPLALSDLSIVKFSRAADRRDATDRASAPVVFYLNDGGRLPGRLVGSASNALVSTTVLGEAVELPFDRLAGVRIGDDAAFPRSAELFDAALADRMPGRDVLVTRSADKPQVLPGRLVELGPEQGSFVFGDRTRTLPTSKIFGVAFAIGSSGSADIGTTFQLSDGSLLAGRIHGADANTVRVATSIGLTVTIPLGDLEAIHIQSDRVVYLSDLHPSHLRTEGMLHRPWPVRMDRGVTGKPLSVSGRRFDKGIGCHSYTELVYSIDQAYESFVATIGIDDLVRPRGSVVFRVMGDGKTLFDSGAVTGRDNARDVIVDVRGVKTLTLIVDYGLDLDLSDHAVWGAARLLKPRSDGKANVPGAEPGSVQ